MAVWTVQYARNGHCKLQKRICYLGCSQLAWQRRDDDIPRLRMGVRRGRYGRVKSVGFIRLTYAIEMIDQIYKRNGADVPLEVAMIDGLGIFNGKVQEAFWRNKDTARFEIWDCIADAAAARNIYIHPGFHGGKAQWCCEKTVIATWAQSHPNVVPMSLSNELRRAIDEDDHTSTIGYNWISLVGNYTVATDAMHFANPNILVTGSGMQSAQDLSVLTSGLNLNPAPL
ncbi:Exo-beta-1,3-glucanase [Lecanosticta acicola]|uniref:Exo-beta-1,3-glucanase n=1 Tax=Lecanosticta acicola TaxID=111012 RepID=A0AAI8Z600_9PEZI|nr:Exo-beta-1,3-glucanase [Lecanosticta acicola]